MFAFLFALQGYAAESAWKKDPKDWNVEFYPVYAWAPFMGATVNLPQFPNLPNLPDLPNGPARPSGNATSGISGAAFVGLRVDHNKWSVNTTALWAGMNANTVTPKLDIGLDLIFGQGMVGREILPHLTLEGGVRRMAVNVTANLGDYLQVSRRPGVWDPLIGLTYRRPVGRKWRFDVHADGGGFGVGSDETWAVQGQLDYRFSKHFGMTLGYGLLHFKITSTVLERSLTINQTLNGPILGFGIFF
jgi:hypothetical protein